MLPSGEREQRRGERDGKSAPFEQAPCPCGAEIDAGVEVEVVDPDQSQAEHRETDVRPARRGGLPIDVVHENERPRRRRDPQYQSSLHDRAARTEQLQRIADQLQADYGRDRCINQFQAVLALLPGRGKAVEEAHPQEVACAFGETEDGFSGDHGGAYPLGLRTPQS